MIFLTNDGARFVAKDSEQLIALLREASHTPSKSQEEFMRDVAQRVQLQTGTRIGTDNVNMFLAGLVLAGLVRQVYNGEEGPVL